MTLRSTFAFTRLLATHRSLDVRDLPASAATATTLICDGGRRYRAGQRRANRAARRAWSLTIARGERQWSCWHATVGRCTDGQSRRAAAGMPLVDACDRPTLVSAI
mgnify:CR=1 FL=1